MHRSTADRPVPLRRSANPGRWTGAPPARGRVGRALRLLALGSLAAGASAQTPPDAVLVASDGAPGDEFGAALTVQGGLALVGAPAADPGGVPDAGAAYLFALGPGGGWSEVTKLVASDPQPGDRFGSSVSIYGLRAVVGAPFDDDRGEDAGAAYVFERAAGRGWVQVQKIAPNALEAGDGFGTSVSMFRDELLGGAPERGGPGAPPGALFLYGRHAAGGWFLESAFQPSVNPAHDRFGVSAAHWQDLWACGAWGADAGIFTDVGHFAGAVTLGRRNGPSWNEFARVQPAGVAAGDAFGFAVALIGEQCLAGAPRIDATQPGAAYVFAPHAVLGWQQVAELLPDGSGGARAGDEFGKAVALEPQRALVGAPSRAASAGAVHVFEGDAQGAWSETRELAFPGQGPGARLGAALGASGNRALAGAPGAGGAAAASGAVALYELGPGATYCVSTPSSMGAAAVLSATGSASLARNDLALHAAPVPAQPGIFFLGPAPASVPFGNGIRCVGGSLLRLAPVTPVRNVLSRALDLAAPPLAGELMPGNTWYAQAWFRDPLASGAQFDLSSAIAIAIEP